MKIRWRVSIPIYLGLITSAFAISQTSGQMPPAKNAPVVTTLPADLHELQKITGYRNWKTIRIFSRTLKHYRQLRIDDASNIVISETGGTPGKVDIVEAILLPSEPDEKADFAIYDPVTAKRLKQFPESIQFDIEAIPNGSRDPLPGVCIACHLERKPLNAVIPWSRSFTNDIDRARGRGVGIRQALVDPLSKDENAVQEIESFNETMKRRFPNQFTDLRQWIRPYIEP
jgi:hypothetical protein